ncbi:hypothetical protein V2J09_017093 [Rumex salicifolius]
MAKHQPKLLLLIILTFTLVLSVSSQPPRQFIYNGFKGANLSLDGLANIHANGLLELTNQTEEQMGHAMYPFPLRLSASPLLSTTFVFAINPADKDKGGHGFAFVISSFKDMTQTSGNVNLGIVNRTVNGTASNHVFAVELDTAWNPNLGDIDNNHLGIDVNGVKSDPQASASYYSDKKKKNVSLSLISRKPMQVWIEYNARKKQVSVNLAPLGQPKPSKLLLSKQIDLSNVLLDTIYVGFSASTGQISSNHYVLGWSFNQTGQAESFDLSKLPSIPRRKKSVNLPLVILLPIVLVLMSSVLGLAYAIRRKKFEEVMEDWEEDYAVQRFSYKDLYKATKGFKDKELLGAGGFGKVYKGTLKSNNTQVAVKRISHESRQGMKEFVSEVAAMRRLRHRNLVPLLGYCRRKGELLLVYEYMFNGSLDKFLFNKEMPTLSWPQRFSIIKGVASALLYLHEEWEQVVLHRDIKASNILLDANMNARLGDFGLARLYDHGSNPQTTHIVGTLGYLAPEFSRTGKATTSTDVYAYGAFVLEVACGRRPIDTEYLPNDVILVDFVWECWKVGRVVEASDPRLKEDYSKMEMELVLKVGLLCAQPRYESRPSMRQVMQILNGDLSLPEMPNDMDEISWFGKGSGTSGSLFSGKPSTSMNISFSTTTTTTDSLIKFFFFFFTQILASITYAQDFIYNGFQGSNLHIDGSTNIHSNGLLQLTNFTYQQIGHAFHSLPLKFNTSLSFSTTFAFAMYPQVAAISGHGIAFVISPTTDFTNATSGQYFGIFNSSTNNNTTSLIFAVELDTIQNLELGDIDSNHVGVDVNSLTSIASSSAAYYSDKEGRNQSLNLISGKSMQIWIDYDHEETHIDIAMAPLTQSKPSKVLLTTHLNLTGVLLDSMYVGFSSATGSVASNHYVLGWSFSQGKEEAHSLDYSKLPKLPKVGGKKKPSPGTISLLVILLSLLIMILGAAYVVRKKKYEELAEDWEEAYVSQRLSYKDLYIATKGFKSTELLGEGGFGKVYKGKLPSRNIQVAVKRVSHESGRGMQEFVAEIACMSRVRHRNLVRLLGYSRRKKELLLVYEYMPNGSLDKYLFSTEKPVLSWSQRHRIIKGVASALLYLHEGWEQVIIHRDIKSANVLLDVDMNACVGDFGLAKLYDHGTNPRTTHVVGTVGYLAPELARKGKATTGSDVFALGTFLLEVACGRRPIRLHGFTDQEILVDWVHECWRRGDILEACDPRLGGSYETEEMEMVLKLGLICTHYRPEVRPSMRQVNQFLNGDANLPEVLPGSAGVYKFNSSSNQSSSSFPPFSSSSFARFEDPSLYNTTDSVLQDGR